MMKGQKGITLVALVITIIVMLILAGVTISIVVQGGLFNQATNAVQSTKSYTLDEAVKLALADYVTGQYASNPTETPAALTSGSDLMTYLKGYYDTTKISTPEDGSSDTAGSLMTGYASFKDGSAVTYVDLNGLAVVSQDVAFGNVTP